MINELDCTRGTVRNRVIAGHLHPVKIGRNVYFNPDEVLKLSERLKGERMYKKTPGALPKPKVAVTHSSHRPSPSSSKNHSYDGYDSTTIGKLSARAVKIYDAGKNVRDVVVDLEISFELAKHFYEQWKTTGSEWHLPYRSLMYLRSRFNWTEEDPTTEGLLAAVNRYASETMKKTVNYEAPEATGGSTEG